MSELAIDVRAATKAFPGFTLDRLDLSLEKGYVLGLIGPNGSGKTTTIRLLMGLAAADSGSVRILGEDPRKAGPALRERLGFVYDESKWYGTLTARENAAWASRLYGTWDWAAWQARIGAFALDPKKRLDDLSKGQKMKFSLAMALSHRAELIVMDEPTGGLDPVSRSELLDALFGVVAEGKTSLLFSTHVTQDLERIADYVAFLKEGRLVFSEGRDEVLSRHALVRGGRDSLSSGVEALLLGRRLYEGGFEGVTDKAEELKALAPTLGFERASLEDIMVYSVREDYHARPAL
jgi:ABC-2 type transport system ATP-binding protein